MTQPGVCELLPWDTDFFGFRVARVNGSLLTPERVATIDAFCIQEQVRCLYFLASLEDPATTYLAEKFSFHYADVRMTYEFKLPSARPIETNGAVMRLVKADDLPKLTEIARQSYDISRFYHDPNFPQEKSAQLYETWIKVSCNGYAESVWIAELDQRVAGYITCHIDEEPAGGRIGLVGVNPNMRGRGFGKLLVHYALEWFDQQGLPRATVVTQGRNIHAQRLYQRCGFVTQSIQLWYHKWYPQTED